MQSYLLRLVFLYSLIALNYGAKILVFNPKFGISHVTFTGKIADTLAHAGHDVVSLTFILHFEILLSFYRWFINL